MKDLSAKKMPDLPGPLLGDELFGAEGLFGARGITREIAEARPHVRYEVGDVDTVFEADLKFLALPSKRQNVLRQRVRRAPGIVMMRHPVPIRGGQLDEILAELRPDWPIFTGEMTWHDHAEKMAPIAREKHRKRRKVTAEDVMRGGFVSEKLFAEGFGRGADHFGKEREGRHFHAKVAKYLFASSEKLVVPRYAHRHTDIKNHRRLLIHILLGHLSPNQSQSRAIREQDRASFAESPAQFYQYYSPDRLRRRHTHHREIKADDALAMRLDIHPMSVAELKRAKTEKSRVFFALEGCLKADSILSQGEPVFSVPSVTLWNAPELAMFARQWLKGPVYIVPDSDWVENSSVSTQAFLCRETLRGFGVDAHVAAPPSGAKAEKVGIDDWLGSKYNGTVDELEVLDREAPTGLAKWKGDRIPRRRGRWQEGDERDAAVLKWLALCADADGNTQMAASTIARYAFPKEFEDSPDSESHRVNDALKSLIACGAVSVDMPLNLRRLWWQSNDLNWEDGPTITVARELRATGTTWRIGDR